MKNKQSSQMVATVWRHWSPVFKKYWLSLSISSIAYMLSLYADLLKPAIWKNVFDTLISEGNPWDYFKLIVVCALTGWIMNRIGEYSLTYCQSRIIEGLKNYALKGLLGKSTEFFNSHPSGALIAKAKRFAAMSETVIDQSIFFIFKTIFLVIYLIVFTALMIPKVSPIFFIWVSVFCLLTFIMLRIRTKYDLESAKSDSHTVGEFSDIILSIFTLRIFSSMSSEFEHFKMSTKKEAGIRRTAWNFGHIHWALQGILMIILEVSVMYFVVTDVINKKESIGTAVMIQSYIGTLMMYMYNLGQSVSRVRTCFADAYEMSVLLDEVSTESLYDENLIKDKNIFKRNICFENIEFSYPKGEQILKRLDFNFIGGKHYGLVGHSGAGKSTIVKLLLRIYEKNSGKICLKENQNCIEVGDIGKNQLRSMIAYVPQQPIFPSRTVREIVSLGKKDATDKEIVEALKKAKAEFVWEKLSDGLDTFVGERGIKLSGGEAQRLAIACAILKDAPIVIMDEPTSALDSITERSIQESIREHFKEKTLIVIAHRLSTVAVLDEVVLMDDGIVVNSGKHEDLLKKSEVYQEMWNLQTNPMIV